MLTIIVLFLHHLFTNSNIYVKVAIPSVDENGSGRSNGYNGEDILTRMRDRSLRDLAYLINKPPRWNEQVCLACTTSHGNLLHGIHIYFIYDDYDPISHSSAPSKNSKHLPLSCHLLFPFSLKTSNPQDYL